MNEEWNGDENLRNLYQQIAGSLNYAAQLPPELMFSVSQLSRVMSCPTQENLICLSPGRLSSTSSDRWI